MTTIYIDWDEKKVFTEEEMHDQILALSRGEVTDGHFCNYVDDCIGYDELISRRGETVDEILAECAEDYFQDLVDCGDLTVKNIE